MRVLRFISILTWAALCVETVLGREPVYSWRGESNAESAFGGSVAGVGDIDGDGVGDVAVASKRAVSYPVIPGKVYLFSGRTGRLIRILEAEDDHYNFAYAIAGSGDIDGDGRGDVIVSQPGRGFEGDHGFVYVYSGRSGRRLLRLRGRTIEKFGATVAGVGDVNKDGIPDIGVSVGQQWQEDRESIFVFSGKDGSLVWSWDIPGEEFLRISSLGDVTGDGAADVLVGAPYFDGDGGIGTGKIAVLSGTDGSVVWEKQGGFAWAALGSALSSLGDVDGDGFPEVVAGWEQHDGEGRKYCGLSVFSGASGVLVWSKLPRGQSDAPFQRRYQSLAGNGDFNGDGICDVVVGHRWRILVFSGDTGRRLAEIHTEEEWWLPGYSVSFVGDVTGDDLADIVTGAPTDGIGAAGKAYLYKGYR